MAGALLFKVSCPLCCSRPSVGPPDDLSSCSFEGQYTPRGPDTRTNDKNTDSSGQPPGVRPMKVATTYVTQSGGLWVPVPLSKPATAVNRRGTRAEATQRALTFKTRRGGKDCVVLEAPDSHRMATTHPSSQVGAWTLYCCESTQWPQAEQSGSRTARVRRVHSAKTSCFADSISCPLPRGTSNTTVRACHTHDAGGGGGEGRLTTQWLAALRVKVFKAVVFKVFMAVVLSGCQCWSPKGGRREKGEAGALLFKVSCPLCCLRPSLGPPGDLSSCSFEGQYTPRGPDTRTNDETPTAAGSRRG